MELFYIIASALAIGGALAVWYVGGNTTFFFGISVAAILLTLPVFSIVMNIERNDNQTFYEFWNGHEVSADVGIVECERDGQCVNEYDCDPYQVTRVESYTDSDGNTQSRTVVETHYHSCPYSSEETTWSVHTTLGNYVILGSAMTGDEWRANRSIPGGKVTSPPEFWVAAAELIKAGTPSGVTVQKKYKNYILGSDSTIFKEHEAEISDYLDKGLLPKPASQVYNFYMSDKAYFAGVPASVIDSPAREKLIQDVQNLNAKAGAKAHADVHVVFVDSSKVQADEYASVLHSYWVSPDLGRNAIAKNAVVVVVGVDSYKEAKSSASDSVSVNASPVIDDSSSSEEESEDSLKVDESALKDGDSFVSWTRSFTGMPVGNEGFIQNVQNIKNVLVNGELIGSPEFKGGTFDAEPSGLIEAALFDDANGFERVSMDNNDADDVGSGFKYLSDGYELSNGGYLAVYLISGFLVIIGFGFASMLAFRYDYYRYDLVPKRDN